MNLDILSYNFNGQWNKFENRKPGLKSLLNEFTFDILCAQEFNINMHSHFNELKDYNCMPTYFVPIFVKKDIKILKHHHNINIGNKTQRFLDVNGQRFNAVLLEKDGTEFLVCNCHFDFRNFGKLENLRIADAKSVINFINETYPRIEKVLICGDFNCMRNSKPIEMLTQKFNNIYNEFDPKDRITWNGYNKNPQSYLLDYMFTKGIKRNTYEIVEYEFDKKYPSDHHPLYLNASF